MVQAVAFPMLQPSLRRSRSFLKDQQMVPLEPLAPHPSLPVLYHSSTMNSSLLERARLGSSTLSCMLTRPLSLMSQAGRTLDVAPMGSQLGRGGTLLLVWDHQSILTSRQLPVCKHWYYHLSFCIIIYKYILVELRRADIRVLVATPLSFHAYILTTCPNPPSAIMLILFY